MISWRSGYRIYHDALGMLHVKRLWWHPRHIWLSLIGWWRRRWGKR